MQPAKIHSREAAKGSSLVGSYRVRRKMTAIAPSQQMATVSAMRPAAITTAPAAWPSS